MLGIEFQYLFEQIPPMHTAHVQFLVLSGKNVSWPLLSDKIYIRMGLHV